MGGVQDSTPAGVAPVMEMIPSLYVSSTIQTIPQYVSVPRADLAGPFPWYKAIPGTADVTEEAPGLLVGYTNGVAAQTVIIEVDGEIEFKTAITSIATPEEAELRARILELRVREAQKRVANSGVKATAAALSALASPEASRGPSTRLAPK